MNHLNIIVIGRVQGVWFRVKTKEKADELGIYGFVKNRINGNVYIEAEGAVEKLNRFVTWCKLGPKLAYVEELQKEYGALKNFTNFQIKH